MKTWNIRARVFGGLAVIMLSLLTLGAIAYTRFQTIKVTAAYVTEDCLPSVYLIGKLQADTLLRFTLLIDHINAPDPAGRARLEEQIEKTRAELDNLAARYERLIDSPADRRLFAALQSARMPYSACYASALQLSRQGKREEALRLIKSQLNPLRNRVLNAAEAEIQWNRMDADRATWAIKAAVDWSSAGILILLVVTLGVTAIARDAVKRFRAEHALREKEQLFREVFQNAPFGISVAGLDGRFIQVNTALCHMLGYSELELLAMTWVDLTHPAHLSESLQREEQFLADPGTCLSGEKRYVHRNGSVVWARMKLSSVRYFGSGLQYLVVHWEDITERKRVEDALQESEGRFDNIADSCPTMIWMTDAEGKLQSVNRACRENSGLTAEELEGFGWQLILHPDDAQQYIQAFHRALRERSIFRAEARMRHAGSEWRCLGSHAAPRFSRSGEFLGHVGLSADITQRRQAEQEMRDAREFAQATLDALSSHVCVLNRDGVIIAVNRAWTSFAGANSKASSASDSSQSVSMDCFGVGVDYLALCDRVVGADADSAAQFAAGIRTVLEGGGQFEAEYACHSPLLQRWFVGRVTRFLTSGGIRILIEHIDITALKLAEAKLTAARQAAEAEARHHEFQHSLVRAIHEVSLDGILVVDAGLNIVSHNSRFLDTWGIPQATISGDAPNGVRSAKPMLAAAGDRVRNPEPFLRRIQELYNDPDATDHCEIELNDGRTLERYSTSIRGEKGQPLGRAWFFRDITLRRQAELALQGSEAKFRQLAENISQVFWIVDPAANTFLYVSPAYEQIWGRPCESVYRNPRAWAEPVHPDDLELAQSNFARKIQGCSADSEYRIRTLDGQEKWIRSRSFPIRSHTGELVRIVGIAEDITEQKRLIEELVRTRDAADSANRAKSNFLAQMSHEIRTPMNGIIGMLQLLAETSLSTLQQQYAEVAQQCGHALLSIIDDILDLSKIEARKVSLEHLDFNLRRILESSLESLQLRAKSKGLGFQVSVAAQVPELLRGDPQRLRQVVGNLVSNAIKFTHSGMVSVDVRLESRQQGKSSPSIARLRFTVADTGIGIRPDQAGELFSPFVQGDSSTTRKYGGTGLGLAICRQLVEMMDGKIGFDSREGQGSTFWFTAAFGVFPDRPAQPSAAPASSNQATPAIPATPRPELPPCHGNAAAPWVLVADDHPANQMVMLALLERLGYLGKAVSNGAEALETWRQGNYDVVLMDWHMPVMDGPEAVRRIRQASPSHVPIIAVTASAMSGDREACLNAGADDYLAKPVDLQRLAQVLARWTGQPGSAPACPIAEPPASRESCPVFDESGLLDRLLQDRRLAGHVMSTFLADCPSQLDILRRRLDEADAGAVRLQAHSLQGAAATVSACRLRAIARELESAARDGRLEHARTLLPRAVGEFREFKGTVDSIEWSQT